MNSISENTQHQRRCSKCKEVKPLTKENFHCEKSRRYGFTYNCKACESKRGAIKRIKNPQLDTYKKMTQEQKDRKSAKARIYAKTLKGRAIFLASAYRKSDKKKNRQCDVDYQFILNEIFLKPCFYCGDNLSDKGCDRIDNSIGHTKNNVVPCCRYCNILRGDSYSVDEMKIIGDAINKVKEARRFKLKAA